MLQKLIRSSALLSLILAISACTSPQDPSIDQEKKPQDSQSNELSKPSDPAQLCEAARKMLEDGYEGMAYREVCDQVPSLQS